jgi:hypothetical protein
MEISDFCWLIFQFLLNFHPFIHPFILFSPLSRCSAPQRVSVARSLAIHRDEQMSSLFDLGLAQLANGALDGALTTFLEFTDLSSTLNDVKAVGRGCVSNLKTLFDGGRDALQSTRSLPFLSFVLSRFLAISGHVLFFSSFLGFPSFLPSFFFFFFLLVCVTGMRISG